MSAIETKRDLKLVDLTGEGLTWLGADGRLFTGSYQVAQQWALSLYAHPRKPDGLFYRSRHDPSRFAIAFYSQQEQDFQLLESWEFLSEAYKEKLADILNIYRYGIV